MSWKCNAWQKERVWPRIPILTSQQFSPLASLLWYIDKAIQATHIYLVTLSVKTIIFSNEAAAVVLQGKKKSASKLREQHLWAPDYRVSCWAGYHVHSPPWEPPLRCSVPKPRPFSYRELPCTTSLKPGTQHSFPETWGSNWLAFWLEVSLPAGYSGRGGDWWSHIQLHPGGLWSVFRL